MRNKFLSFYITTGAHCCSLCITNISELLTDKPQDQCHLEQILNGDEVFVMGNFLPILSNI